MSTSKDVQNNGVKNSRLVDSVLEEVKLNSFGAVCLDSVKYVDRPKKQDVSSTFSSYNLFEHLLIEEVYEESDLNDSEDKVMDGITEECASRPVKICKNINKNMVKKRKAKVSCKLVNKRVDV